MQDQEVHVGPLKKLRPWCVLLLEWSLAG